MRRRRDRYNPFGDPLDEQVKADKAREANRESMKKRLKGTGKIDRSFHTKKEDL